ncbi:tetratricopeptide repeat protein [Gelidibacter salicanalis]|uniref:histidine kinase n=1 Tax=Gelidibacter salicanalis TaxID=291193 RepID=A0A934NIR1_9FLAO|nr:tetratricopeptide repeat protein [Gelidibacter salicanalis]MBJ7881488.1 tetratricopeptide repeat protein [Gelidibacter salicanalis]
MTIHVLRPPILFLLFLCSCPLIAQDIVGSSEYDSILKFRKLGEDPNNSLEIRLKYAKKAVNISHDLEVDSIVLRSNKILSTAYLYIGDYDAFSKINHENLKISKRISDTLNVGMTNHNLGFYHTTKSQNDSAYYYYTKAIKSYEQSGEVSRKIEVMANLSLIQYIERDYFGSEDLCIQALRLLAQLPTKDSNLSMFWILYNRLGIISLDLGLYEKSLEYHDRAIGISKKIGNGESDYYTSIHNKAFVLRKQGAYGAAIKLYEEILQQKDLFIEDPSFYPLILDNIAFTKFESQDKDYGAMENMFMEAYRLSDSLDDPTTKLAVSIDLSKFYKGQGKNDQALHFAQESYDLAGDISSNDILLESMILLSELKAGDEGKSYFKEYIRLSDSLLAHERGIRNKFARVHFETDQIELENQKIATEKMWWIISSVVLLLTSILVYIIITQRNKNRELKFRQDQQEANEEIYNLMLSQQDKVDGAKAEEKKRISQELHDGVLGRLFGTRLSLDSYNFNEGKEAVQVRSKYIAELKTIENDIRKISHDLSTDFVSGSGFMDIMTELIDKQTQAYQLESKFDFTDDINWEAIPNKTKINLYRMVQESLHNIYKHAKAKRVNISIQLKKAVICLSITDDGSGFDSNKSKKGIGLKNINSRAKELNGTVTIQSQIDKGTTLQIKTPYTT